ncbi:hypothetical protein Acid345_3226 [Candidatus Koribacter versatilis Ellin345]|uniref:Uncharacterized protein n=1 Tax=Koribacter versatilis (strain Ellin345) TaxID=204669 RepID=Q1ILM3_KORVE|nr:hypothetical protein [Candidatus Koribacter versatilis]ABF42227.1 hypothetical protein Acid345_3226 [Candidatus Koribacter versatilis Ellin345]
MLCEHLHPLEEAIAAVGIRETFRGAAWSKNCREWVYFDCYLELAAIRALFKFAPCVIDESHRGTHDGSERGLVCNEHWDAVMGVYEPQAGTAVYPTAATR